MAIFSFNGQDLKRLLTGGCRCLNSNRQQLNDLNIFPVPDGDTGTNMVLTMRGAISLLHNHLNNSKDLHYAARLAAQGAIRSAHGNSGVILSQIFNGLAQGLTDKKEAEAKDLSLALDMARQLAYEAVQNPLEGTILSIIKACAQFSQEQDYSQPTDLGEFFHKIVEISLHTLLATTPIDAGGLGLLYIFKGMLAVIEGKNLTTKTIEIPQNFEYYRSDEPSQENFPYRFCTEFLLSDRLLNPESIKREIATYGDSIVIAQDEKFTKIHIHTNVPLVLQRFFNSISPSCQYKIEDMCRQRLHRLPKNTPT
ncbi:DAK2 domain-containing protein, partial [bacterium]|nr:DAK2 domain-containing protein [bacterium]